MSAVENRAHYEVRRARNRGALKPEPCFVGIRCWGRIEAHHDDYSLPLAVRWLCKRHHRRLHYWLAKANKRAAA